MGWLVGGWLGGWVVGWVGFLVDRQVGRSNMMFSKSSRPHVLSNHLS